jgi:hypothetical protein
MEDRMIKKRAAEKKTVKKKAVKKAVAGKTAKKKPQINLQDFLEEVRKGAYDLFLQRGSTHGNDLEDWLKAEKKIKRKYGIK